jgi:hypothetical protein
MALIEYLEREDWRGALQRSFEGALQLLKTDDRFRMTSSSIDDMRSWFVIGGASRVQQQLDREMNARRLVNERQVEIRDRLKQLIQDNRSELLHLIAEGVIPLKRTDFLVTCGISESEFEQWQQQVLQGGNPFEAQMLAQGYSLETIAQIYQVIDRWLVEVGWQSPTSPIDSMLN